ncbi:MAG: MafB family polymorphic toxin, partial [Cardiobacteriaceae bacterium]|nr:MafB family polymorphic toxin [Cardiobacteriaceae bacterium]
MRFFNAIVKIFLAIILCGNISFADDFLRRATDENSYISGDYQLFSKRGSPANVESSFSVSPSYPIRAGNISIEHRGFNGNVKHTSEFGGHGWQVHSPFSNSSSLHLDDLSGSILVGGSSHNKLTVSGRETHHGEDYDGPQGGGFPEPTGARDHYSYGISGSVVTVKVVSLEQINKFLPQDRQITPETVRKINTDRDNSVDIPAILSATNLANQQGLAQNIYVAWDKSTLETVAVWQGEVPIVSQSYGNLPFEHDFPSEQGNIPDWARQIPNIATQNNNEVGLIPNNSNTDKGFWAKTKDGLVWVGEKLEYAAGTAIGIGKGGLNILGDSAELVFEGLGNLYDEGKDFVAHPIVYTTSAYDNASYVASNIWQA